MLLLTCLFLLETSAQTSKKIKELESRRNELQRQIQESETLLSSTKKDVKSQLSNLALITGQIDERKKYISTIERDVQTINSEVYALQLQLKAMVYMLLLEKMPMAKLLYLSACLK